MPALKVTYPTKTNNPSDPDNIKKFLAVDANELKEVTSDHADRIDLLEDALLTESLNPYYGKYTSLAILQAAHTTGEANAWAIIDEGAGITPLIVYWDVIESEWKISTAQTTTIEVASYANLPAPGVEGIFYITKDTSYLYRWYNSQYNLIGGGVQNEVRIQGALVETFGKTDLNNFEVGDKFRIWIGDRLIHGIIQTIPITLTSEWNTNKVKLAVNSLAFEP